jgi:hypothetical protein
MQFQLKLALLTIFTDYELLTLLAIPILLAVLLTAYAPKINLKRIILFFGNLTNKPFTWFLGLFFFFHFLFFTSNKATQTSIMIHTLNAF